MSPQEVIAIHREMTQDYNDRAVLADVAVSIFLSLFVVIAIFVLAAGAREPGDSQWTETVVRMGDPQTDAFPAHSVSH